MNATIEYLYNERKRIAVEHPERDVRIMNSLEDIKKFLSYVYVVKENYATFILFQLTGQYTHDNDCGFNAWGVELYNGHMDYMDDSYFEIGSGMVEVKLVDDEFWKLVEEELKRRNIQESEIFNIKRYYWNIHFIEKTYLKRCGFVNRRIKTLSRKKIHKSHNIIIKELLYTYRLYNRDLNDEDIKRINNKLKSI